MWGIGNFHFKKGVFIAFFAKYLDQILHNLVTLNHIKNWLRASVKKSRKSKVNNNRSKEGVKYLYESKSGKSFRKSGNYGECFNPYMQNYPRYVEIKAFLWKKSYIMTYVQSTGKGVRNSRAYHMWKWWKFPKITHLDYKKYLKNLI